MAAVSDAELPEQCEHCGKSAFYGIEEKCRACNDPVARKAPNVRLAGRREEQAVLEARYRAACDRAKREGNAESLVQLERIAERTAAVVSVTVGLAYDLFKRGRLLFNSYEQQVRARLRAPADVAHDRRRRAVGSLLYGTYGEDIVYAALSMDSHGLTSYGPVHLKLEEVTIAYRATVLEENSFHFMERHNVRPATPFPQGYLALWEKRGRLAVAKLGNKVTPGMSEDAYGKLLLDSQGERESDLFLEVHIYGTFNYQAVQGIEFPSPGSVEWLELDEVEIVQLHFLEQQQNRLATEEKT